MQFRDNKPREILLEEKFNVNNVSRLLLSDLLETCVAQILTHVVQLSLHISRTSLDNHDTLE